MRTKSILTSFFLAIFLFSGATVFSQSSSGIDYSQKSNFIDPDTLSEDFKAIFWHFVDLKSEQVMDTTPEKLKAEFAKLGLVPEEKERFYQAYKFYSLTMEAHKKSCEQWESFKDLAPKKKE